MKRKDPDKHLAETISSIGKALDNVMMLIQDPHIRAAIHSSKKAEEAETLRPPKPKIKPGDVVKLRSGDGPQMTAHRFCGKGELQCVWFDTNHKSNHRIFSIAALKHA